MNSLQNFTSDIEQELAAFLWRQWTAVGVASAVSGPADDWVIDPEALLLLTCSVGRAEPRLFDEVIDWLAVNAHFVNIPRARSLMRRSGTDATRVLAAMTETVRRNVPGLSWAITTVETPVDPEPLFLGAVGGTQPIFGTPDPVFLKQGFHRGQVDLRGMSRRFPPERPECVLLRLRALIGTTARADILLYLLTHRTGHASGMARDLGFSQRTVHDTLVDMEASGVVQGSKARKHRREYHIPDPYQSSFPLDSKRLPRWVCWPPLMLALGTLHTGLRQIATVEGSDLLLATKLQELVDRMLPELESAELTNCFHHSAHSHGEAYLDALQDDVRELLKRLGPHGAPRTAAAKADRLHRTRRRNWQIPRAE